MRNLSEKLTFLTGSAETFGTVTDTPALPMFSENAVRFLSALSSELMHDSRTRHMPDVMSYAYWIRRASLSSEITKYPDRDKRLGRGIAFHIAPSNVPVNFAVSMTSSLLAGNITIVRVSDKQFEQVEVICDAVRRLICGDHADMEKYLYIIRYPHNDDITAKLSAVCDLRIIWGGDRTIADIRRAPLPPRAIEMTFADRHSVAVINAEKYLAMDPADVAKRFYTDTYYTDQNACSSPRIVFWMGERTAEARERFWSELAKLVHRDYQMKPIQAVDKYSMLCKLGMDRRGVRLIGNDNTVVRIEADKLTADITDFKYGGGYFFEYIGNSTEELVPVLGKRCQTVSVLGVEKSEILSLVMKHGVRGVDRIVPLGETMGLEFVWDGYKMIEAMTRLIYTGIDEHKITE